MHVLLLCGSLQRASANRAALDAAQTTLSALGATVESFDDLASIPALNPDHMPYPGEAVRTLRERIGAADAILIAAPEYAGALGGATKNALDWIVSSGELYGKPVAVVSAGTTGGVYARRDLVRTLSWQSAHVVASLGIEGPKEKSETIKGAVRFTDPATLGEIASLAEALVRSVSQSLRERAPAILRLTADAGVDAAPILAHVEQATS